MNQQELCEINGGITTKYFKLEKSTQQGHPISLCLEMLLTKNNRNIKGIKLIEKTFLYTAYADDSTYFLKVKTRSRNY